MMAYTYRALQFIKVFIYIIQFGLSFQLLAVYGIISCKGKDNKYKWGTEEIYHERE